MVTAAYEVLSDPEKRQMYDLGGDPFSAAAGVGGFGGGRDVRLRRHHGRLLRRRRASAARARARGAARTPSSASQVDLADAVFGSTRDLTVDTAVLCTPATAPARRPAARPRPARMCKGRGEIQQVQRSFLGQVMTSRPCPQCQGFGTTIPHPCPECSGDGRVRTRRTLTVQIPPGVDTGTRIQLSGEGEVGPNGGPAGDLFVEIVVAAAPMFRAAGRRAALRRDGAHDGGRARHRDHPRHPRRPDRRSTSGRARRRARRWSSRARARRGCARRGRGDLHVHLSVQTPTQARRPAGGAPAPAGRPARRGHRPARHPHRPSRPAGCSRG